MSSDDTNAYLQAKLQQAQGQQVNEQPKKVPLPKATKKAQAVPEDLPHVSVDLQAFRQVIEEVVRTELQALVLPQPLDMEAFRQVVQAAIRAELQSVHTTLTILTNAIQAQVDALTPGTDDEDQEQDDLLPTAPTRRTDDDKDRENEQVYPPDDADEDFDEEDRPDGDEEEVEDHITSSLPRPDPPTHKLKRPGPIALLLGDGINRPSAGVRRWESIYEQ